MTSREDATFVVDIAIGTNGMSSARMRSPCATSARRCAGRRSRPSFATIGSIRFAAARNDQSKLELRCEVQRATDLPFAVCQHDDGHLPVNHWNQRGERSVNFGPTYATRVTLVDLYGITIALRVEHHLSQRCEDAHKRPRISTTQRREADVHSHG